MISHISNIFIQFCMYLLHINFAQRRLIDHFDILTISILEIRIIVIDIFVSNIDFMTVT